MKSQKLEPLDRLINEFTKLPGVGYKTAQRYAYAVINNMTQEEAGEFAKALMEAKQKIKYCGICGNFSDKDICWICSNRKSDIICVVSEPKDVLAFEKVRDFGGVYHVLHGNISPLQSKGPDDINIKQLIKRVSAGNIKEVILATNPTVEGEATAVYIAKLLKTLGVKTTRLAQGLAAGSDIEYADEVTLTQALNNRKEI
ncbi:MAG: recombination protein RecR [Clostridiales bacterium]|jgi:recombination protein RecR|nr:recombination protein RecR [Clostridiales bacterium]